MPYQQAPSPPMTTALRRACSQSVHVIKRNGQIVRGARAVLFFLETTRYGSFARFVAHSPLIWPLECAYRIVANNRPFFARFFFRK
jgi:predicted DCC family thiol-disulfide oxidoreductase YuxK